MQSRTIVFCAPCNHMVHLFYPQSPSAQLLTRRLSVRAGVRRTGHVGTWLHNVGVNGYLTGTRIIVLPASH
jgi:hypothetical protein